MNKINFFWFRRDLRLEDNAGLFHALKNGNVQCIFIFDTNILDKLEDKNDRRVVFIHRQLERLNDQLKKFGSGLLVKIGNPIEIWKKLTGEYDIKAVFCNHDYEPYARERDSEVEKLLAKKDISFHTFKDQVVFEKSDVVKDDGTPYLVFTPYMKKWRSIFHDTQVMPFETEKYFSNFRKGDQTIPAIEKTGFKNLPIDFPLPVLKKDIIVNYENTRDIPSVAGTSRISVHLRFGTISIRQAVSFAWKLSEKWVNELIWREFYMMILWHFPHVTNSAFKSSMKMLPWKHDEEGFKKWCEGKTGYPIVDAGMHELNETGFMHNRVRMITSMFLTKYLLIDWQWGEAYFAQKLLDFELSSNNGGWQWSAGTGVDAAPYFRFFSMAEQTKRFDPQLKYIQKWLGNDLSNYPPPIIDYNFARKKCMEFYKS